MLIGDTSKIELAFGYVGFGGEGKTGVPREKPLGTRTRTNNKLNPHMTPGGECSHHCAIPAPRNLIIVK